MSLDYEFNVFTGTLDLVNVGGAAGPTPTILDALGYSVIAGENLSGQVLVKPRTDLAVVRASNADADSLHRPVWLTTTAALSGAAVVVLALGPWTEPSWAWTPGAPVYLGVTGALTQTPPSAPAALFSLEVGMAESATVIFFNPKIPVTLA